MVKNSESIYENLEEMLSNEDHSIGQDSLMKDSGAVSSGIEENANSGVLTQEHEVQLQQERFFFNEEHALQEEKGYSDRIHQENGIQVPQKKERSNEEHSMETTDMSDDSVNQKIEEMDISGAATNQESAQHGDFKERVSGRSSTNQETFRDSQLRHDADYRMRPTRFASSRQDDYFYRQFPADAHRIQERRRLSKMKTSIVLETVTPVSKLNAKATVLHEECHRDIQRKIISIMRPLFDGKKYIALMDPATHANTGDSMIVQGEIDFIRRMGHAMSYMCGCGQDGQNWLHECDFDQILHWDKSGKFMSKKEHWLLLEHGGGNWGNIWYAPHKARRITFRKLVNQGFDVVQMPVSVWWTPASSLNLKPREWTEEKVFWNEWEAEEKNSLSSPRGKLKVVLRQEQSYEYLRDNFPMISAMTAPDIAFMMPPQLSMQESEIDVLFLLRRDKESAERPGSYLQELKALAAGFYLNYSVQDWSTIHRFVGDKDKFAPQVKIRGHGFDPMVRITQAVSAFSKARVIVTNRLHASILAFLMNKPHIMLDNTYGKLNGTRHLAFHDIPSCTDDAVKGYYAQDMQDVFLLLKRLLDPKEK